MPVRQEQQAEARLLERVGAIGECKRQETGVEHGCGCVYYYGNNDAVGGGETDGLRLEVWNWRRQLTLL